MSGQPYLMYRDGERLPGESRQQHHNHQAASNYDEQIEGSYRPRQDYDRSPGMQNQPSEAQDQRYGNRAEDHHDDPHDYRGMYDEPQPGDRDYGRDRYGDRRRDEFSESRSRPKHRRGRSQSQSPTRGAGYPNDTVILEGLPHGVSTDEAAKFSKDSRQIVSFRPNAKDALRESLLHDTVAGDFPSIDVRVQASRGQRRAFVQFESLEDAKAFVKEHYPKVLIQLQDNTDEVPDGTFDAYIHYARKRDEGDSKGQTIGNWNCPACDFSNYSTRAVCKVCGTAPIATNWQQSLTGAADAADVPSQILVIYPVASFVDEAKLAGEVKRLEKEQPAHPKNTADGAPKLKSTAPGGNSTAHGAREGSLHRVFLMRDANTNESFKYGFAEFWTLEDAAAAFKKAQDSRSYTVAGFAANVSTIHLGVFLPEDREASEETEMQSFHPLFNPTLRVRYRDPHVYPSQYIVTSEAPSEIKKVADDAQKSKKRKADLPPGASAVKKTAVAMGGQMALWQKKHDEIHEDKGRSGESCPSRVSPPKSEPKAAIKISLSGSTIAQAASATPSEDSRAVSNGPAEDPVSYVDRDRLMCLICMRKYKNVEEVDIHERSRNHKNATENEEQVKAALPRLAARDKRQGKTITPSLETTEDGNGAQYRDRAKERRQAHGPASKASSNPSKPQTDESKSKSAPAKPAQSKGAGMLAKMGWTSGGGLGANGDGRTEAIATNAYQQGVGLGAEGGNLGDASEVAERKTTGTYADYVNSVQDRARERYNKMG